MKVTIKLFNLDRLLLEVELRSPGTLAAEIGACQMRIKKGSATHYELIQQGKATEVHYS